VTSPADHPQPPVIPQPPVTPEARLAVDLVRRAVPVLDDGYRELVTHLRGDDALRRAVAGGGGDVVGRALDAHLLADLRKANGELVSRGEQAAGALVRRLLRAERPGDWFKGEETGVEPGTSSTWWLDDPVDGTAAMVATALAEAFGIVLPVPGPAFGSTLAVVRDGVAVAGVVAELRPVPPDDPAAPGLRIAHLWVGEQVDGGYVTHTLTGRPPAPVAGTGAGVAVVTTAPEVMFRGDDGARDPVLEAGFEALLDALGAPGPVTGRNVVGIVQAAGGTSVAYERDLTIEDVAAAVPVLAGLPGMRVSDAAGQPMRFTDLHAPCTVVAARADLWQVAVTAVRDGEARARRDGATPSTAGYFDRLFALGAATGYAQKFVRS